MTKKDRVISAISYCESSGIPHNIELCSELSAAVCERLSIKKDELFDMLGNHIEKVGFNRGNETNGIFIDEYGVQWDRTGMDKEIGIIKNPVLKDVDLSGYVFPKIDFDFVRETTRKLLNNGRDTFKLGKIGTALFERAWSLRGFENFLMDIACEEDFVSESLEQITEFNLKIIDTALEFDLDGFYFGDDYGQQNGLLINPVTWRSLIKPNLAKMFAAVKSKGKVVALHSCGDISLILDDLIEIGLDVYQTFQPEIYDLKSIKQRYGKSLTFWGGISTQQTLPFVSPSELVKIVRETAEIMGNGGGYIAAPTHQVPFDVSVENVLALAEIFKELEK